MFMLLFFFSFFFANTKRNKKKYRENYAQIVFKLCETIIKIKIYEIYP